MDQSLEMPFIGMNIHLPAILVFTMGIGFWPISIFLVLNALGGMQHAHKNPSLWKDTPGGMAMPCYACLVSKFLQHRWCKWVERVCFYHIPKHISNHISNHDNSHLGYALSKFQSNSCAFPNDISQIIGKFGIHPISKWFHFLNHFGPFGRSLKGSITHQRESTSTNQADDLGWGWGRPRPHGDSIGNVWVWRLVRSLIPMNPYKCILTVRFMSNIHILG